MGTLRFEPLVVSANFGISAISQKNLIKDVVHQSKMHGMASLTTFSSGFQLLPYIPT